MGAGFSAFVKAIKAHCVGACERELCGGCPFEPWSERQRQVRIFLEKREQIAAARRATGGAAR